MTNGGPDPVLFFSVWIASILVFLFLGARWVVRWAKRLITVTQKSVDNSSTALEMLRENEQANRKDQS